MPQGAFILKRGAVANVLNLGDCGARWVKFVDLSNTFAKKRGAIFDHRYLQNLAFANQAWLLRRRVWLGFFSLTCLRVGYGLLSSVLFANQDSICMSKRYGEDADRSHSEDLARARGFVALNTSHTLRFFCYVR